MTVASAAMSVARLRIKDLRAFQDKLEAKQKAGAESTQAWFDDLAAQAKDQYGILQVKLKAVSQKLAPGV